MIPGSPASLPGAQAVPGVAEPLQDRTTQGGEG